MLKLEYKISIMQLGGAFLLNKKVIYSYLSEIFQMLKLLGIFVTTKFLPGKLSETLQHLAASIHSFVLVLFVHNVFWRDSISVPFLISLPIINIKLVQSPTLYQSPTVGASLTLTLWSSIQNYGSTWVSPSKTLIPGTSSLKQCSESGIFPSKTHYQRFNFMF